MALRKFIIERDILGAGTLEREQLRAAAAKSNEVLRQLGPDIQWVDSHVAVDKTFSVSIAMDENIHNKHAEISGFPAIKIAESRTMIDPTTEQAAQLRQPLHCASHGLPSPRRGVGSATIPIGSAPQGGEDSDP